MGPRCLGRIVLLGALLGSAPLSAASFQLTPREVEEAIQEGQRSVTAEEFGVEWQVANSAGATITVVTPFYRLAQEARNAAFKQGTLKPREVTRVLRENNRRLSFWAIFQGAREDFARWYEPVLLARGQEIKASFVQNERTALRQEDGRYLARCLYNFPTDGLRPRDRITLLIRTRDGRQITTFNVDLGAMR
jgi:hypothetical protein